MSDWKIIIPEGITNLVINPSIETNTTACIPVGSVRTRGTIDSKWGAYSLQCVTNNAAAAEGWDVVVGVNGIAILPSTIYTFSVWLTGSGTIRLSILYADAFGAPIINPGSGVFALTANWVRYEFAFTSPVAAAFAELQIRTDIQQGITFYSDGVQFEQQAVATTYCDGDQPGCEWLGLPHNSASQRSAVSRAGGLIQDLADDLDFRVGAMIATGMAPLDLHVDQYAILPGGQLNSIKVLPNILTLTGVFYVDDKPDLHAKRQGMINAVKPDLVPETEEGAQPILLRYEEEPAVDKEIEAHYLSGLEANIDARFECSEDLAIRFLAPDPFWREIGESAQVLDTADPATLRQATGRLRATGQWSALGLVNPPNGPVNPGVYAIAIGPDKKVYFGGDFTGWNADGNRDYLVRYDPQTALWENVEGNNAVGGIVYALAFGPDGTMYMGGAFGNVGAAPVANTARFCAYDYTTDTFSALGNPTAAGSAVTDVRAIDFLSNGDIIIVGNFTQFSNVAGADYVVQWTGAAPYVLIGGASDGTGGVLAVAVDSNDNIYIGGQFAAWVADPNANRWAWYNGAIWASVSGIGLGGNVNALAITNDDLLYVGGEFLNAGGIGDADSIFSWNGTSIAALGIGLVGFCHALVVAPDNSLRVGGFFTSAGGLATDGLARWTKSAWAYTDADLPGAPTWIFALAVGEPDPVINNNYDLWVGMGTTGAVTIAGSVVATHDGTNSVFPRITISRAAGTSAVIKQIRNETTGKELFIDYSLLDGEVLTINLTPTEKSVVSSFFGPKPGAILANSDFGTFELLPGANQITCFVEQVGGAVVAAMVWRDTYWSFD